jgi:flagella synthesis protein FlgN
MENLALILEKMYGALCELEVTLLEENTQLSGSQIDPVSLQVVTDKKSSLLAAIAHYDTRRQEEETLHHQRAPYAGIQGLESSWQQIHQLTVRLSELNQRSGLLLEKQQENVSKLQNAMNKTRVGQMVYGSDGQSRTGASGRSFNINV